MDAFNYLKPDAAIIFSDIMIPALAMGLELDFAPGPKLNRAIQTEADVASLKRPEPYLDFVMNAIELTRAQLPDAASLIGFVGAPLTLLHIWLRAHQQRTGLGLSRHSMTVSLLLRLY